MSSRDQQSAHGLTSATSARSGKRARRSESRTRAFRGRPRRPRATRPESKLRGTRPERHRGPLTGHPIRPAWTHDRDRCAVSKACESIRIPKSSVPKTNAQATSHPPRQASRSAFRPFRPACAGATGRGKDPGARVLKLLTPKMTASSCPAGTFGGAAGSPSASSARAYQSSAGASSSRAGSSVPSHKSSTFCGAGFAPCWKVRS